VTAATPALGRKCRLVSKRERVDVVVRKSGDRWYIDVPSLALYAWAPSFLDAEPAAREVIAAVLDA
jgi:hypothetical protein